MLCDFPVPDMRPVEQEKAFQMAHSLVNRKGLALGCFLGGFQPHVAQFWRL